MKRTIRISGKSRHNILRERAMDAFNTILNDSIESDEVLALIVNHESFMDEYESLKKENEELKSKNKYLKEMVNTVYGFSPITGDDLNNIIKRRDLPFMVSEDVVEMVPNINEQMADFMEAQKTFNTELTDILVNGIGHAEKVLDSTQSSLIETIHQLHQRNDIVMNKARDVFNLLVNHEGDEDSLFELMQMILGIPNDCKKDFIVRYKPLTDCSKEVDENMDVQAMNPSIDLPESIFTKIDAEIDALYFAKNNDYGNSVQESFDDVGPLSTATRIFDKAKRMLRLSKGDYTNKVQDEKLRDTVIDLVTYGKMLLVMMDGGSTNHDLDSE